jgi:hypothetical protein
VGAAACMSSEKKENKIAFWDQVEIDGLKNIYNKAPEPKGSAAKYAQPCKGGMYMGVVNVYLRNRIHNDMRFSGDGRIYKKGENETRNEWLDSRPTVCKYIKISTQDKPENPPQSIDFDFEFLKYTINTTIYQDAIGGKISYDEEMGKQDNYTKITAKITLKNPQKINDSHGYFYRCNFTTADAQYTSTWAINRAQDNDYIFEFQMLNAHPNMPGLFFAQSVGHPSDRLAVLLGGQARPSGVVLPSKKKSKTDTALAGLFFAQYKFDNMQWYKLKIIHAAMANVLSKVEYLHNYLSEIFNPLELKDTEFTYVLDIPTSDVFRTMATLVCHTVLDYITKPYIDAVLQNMEFVKRREDEPLKISKIREVCEYVFLKKYRFLNTLHWTQNNGICNLSDRFELDMESDSNKDNIRAIAYNVVSRVPGPGQVNVFSAHDVFSAYVERFYKDSTPDEFKAVLEDAKQLALNVKYMKTSSNFALVRLRQSCASAANEDIEFRFISANMLEVSKNFISLLMQESPSTEHPIFLRYMDTTLTRLRNNRLHIRLNINDLEDAKTFTFKDTESYKKNEIENDQLDYLVLGRQLHVLAKMRLAEVEKEFTLDEFPFENFLVFKV